MIFFFFSLLNFSPNPLNLPEGSGSEDSFAKEYYRKLRAE
jgi:hypothetical protein